MARSQQENSPGVDLKIEVSRDHLGRLATARSPIAAIAELVWNGLDADATRVEIEVKRNLIGGIEHVTIQDNGRGISHSHALKAFRRLGDSAKPKAVKSQGGRFLHGWLGKGRFRAFFLGARVEWKTVVVENGRRIGFTVSGSLEDLTVFTVSAPQPAGKSPTGTTVTISEVDKLFPSLESSKAVEELASEFALYVTQYPKVEIAFGGGTLNTSRAVRQTDELTIPPFQVDSGEMIRATLSVIEWNIPVDRALLLCDRQGLPLARLPPHIKAPGFNFTAYLKSDLIRRAEERGSLELEALDPELDALVDKAKLVLRSHFRQRASEEAASVVEEWKRDNVYPYTEEPKDPLQKAEQQVFDVLAINVRDYLPDFDETDRASKQLTFRLIRQALESDASALKTILQDVLGLPLEKQEEFARLLEKTSLAAIINASKVVADRLDFVRGLQLLVFDEESREQLKERAQLHRIIADQTWIFGEEFNLAVDDQSLTEVLKAHCSGAGVDILDTSPVLREDGSQGIVDLMLSRTIPQPRAEIREHLIIELKRPRVPIGPLELNQVESYAHAIVRDERFRNTNTTWHFWAVSNQITEIVEEKGRQPGSPPGMVSQLDGGRAKIWVKTWGQVIREAEARLHFFQDKLAYKAGTEGAMKYLRETYARYLPDHLSKEGAAPAT